MAAEQMIKLKADDGAIFAISFKTAKTIPAIRSALETLDFSAREPAPFDLPSSIQSEVFRKILQWIQKHMDDPAENPTLTQGVKSVEITEKWDRDYMKVDQILLFQMALAANILELRPLVDLCSKAIASLIRDKDQQQLQRTFNLRHDWKAEEKEAFKEANQWIFNGEYTSPNEKLQAGLIATRKSPSATIMPQKKGDSNFVSEQKIPTSTKGPDKKSPAAPPTATKVPTSTNAPAKKGR